MPKVRLIVEGITQFDPNTAKTWYKKGDVVETPLTPFIYSRLGNTLEIVFEEPAKVEQKPIKSQVSEEAVKEPDKIEKSEAEVKPKKKIKVRKRKKKEDA